LTTNRENTLRVTIVLILCSFLAAHFCFWLLPNVFESWNSQAIDQLFQIRASSERFRLPYDDTIIHVDLNNTSIKRLEDHYLSRAYFARVIQNLSSMGVSSQVYDFIFAARLGEKDDDMLINATGDAGTVYFGLAFKLWHRDQLPKGNRGAPDPNPYLDQTKWELKSEGEPSSFYVGSDPLTTFPGLAHASAGLGSLSIKFDRDGVLRRVPLLVRYGGAYYPLLPFRVICDYLKVPPENILVRPGDSITLRHAQRPGREQPHDIVIPVDRHGNMIVNYVGPWGRMDHYSFADILLASESRIEMDMWRKEMQGKIVVISDVSTGSTDVGPVPTDANFPLSGVHANIMHGILTGSFLKELSAMEMLLIEIGLLALIFLLSLWFSSIYFSTGALFLTGLYTGIASAGFLYWGLIFPLVRPLLMSLFAVVSILAYRYVREERQRMESVRQRDFIRQTFGRYLSREVVEELLGSPGGLEMGGEIREVTFLVSDLRGFTALSMKLTPQEVISMLNRYLSEMVKVIGRYRGTLNEIEGDGLLTFFGAPLSAPDDHERALACAIEMQNRMQEINREQRRLNLPELLMGIGINTGEVVVGNIGSEERAKYSAIGSPINTAYRVESYTTGGQILISPSTYEKVKDLVHVSGKIEVQFKGVDQPVTLYDVKGIRGKYEINLVGRKIDQTFKLEEPIPIICHRLEDKIVTGTSTPGYLARFGDSRAEVLTEQELELRSNIKILLKPENATGLPGFYAKVLSVESPASGLSSFQIHVEFTWLPNEVRSFLKELVVMP